MLGLSAGSSMLSLEQLAQYHPQFALAGAEGVPLRPNNRVLQAPFSNPIPGAFVDANFNSQISIYSVFTGFEYTIDPSNAFAGSSQKGQSDFYSEQVSGVLFNLQVRGGGDEYIPIDVPMPLQLARRVLNPSIGVWAMWNAQNVFGRFTIATAPTGPQITAWAAFAFLVMGSEGAKYLCMTREECRKILREKHGILCNPCAPPPMTGAPSGQ